MLPPGGNDYNGLTAAKAAAATPTRERNGTAKDKDKVKGKPPPLLLPPPNFKPKFRIKPEASPWVLRALTTQLQLPLPP